jgi:hypothetical protein
MQAGDKITVTGTNYWLGGEWMEDESINGWIGREVTIENISDHEGGHRNVSVRDKDDNYEIFAEECVVGGTRRWVNAKKGDVYVEHYVDEQNGSLREIEWVVASKTPTLIKLQSPDGWIQQRPLMDIPLGTFK